MKGVSRIVAELLVAAVALVSVGVYFTSVRGIVQAPETQYHLIHIISAHAAVVPDLSGARVYVTITLKNAGTAEVRFSSPVLVVVTGKPTRYVTTASVFGSPGVIVLRPGEMRDITFVFSVSSTYVSTYFGGDIHRIVEDLVPLYITVGGTGGGSGGQYIIM